MWINSGLIDKDTSLLNDYYLIAETEYSTAEWDPNNNTIYYKKDGDKYIRVYTFKQIQDSNLFLYKQSITNETAWLSEGQKIECEVVLYSNKEEKGKAKIIIDSAPGSKIVDVVGEDGTTYSQTVTIAKSEGRTLSNLNNGQFWHICRKHLEWPLAFERAAAIETELTLYWTQAVGASKYCEFFIPDSWQPDDGGKVNHFANQMFRIEEDDIILKQNSFIPSVGIYKQKGKTILPKYKFSYGDNGEDKEHAVALNNFTPIKQSFNELNESTDNWFIEESGTTTYYYLLEGGKKWNE